MTYNNKDGFHIGTLLSCILLAVNWSALGAMIIPYSPFLIRIYFPDIKDEDVGTYVGILTSSFFVGQIPGAVLWGRLGDYYGRKRIIIISLLLVTVCTIAFGLSRSFSLSLAIRFLHGIFDGSLPLAKTILSEISNDKNIAVGTSLFFVGTAIGGLVGPILCGYLSNKSNIPWLVAKFPILEQYPFLLPFGFSALTMLFSALCYLLLSVETLTEEERMKMKAMRARIKKGFSGILRKNRSQQDMEERLLVDYHNHSSPGYLFRDKDFLLVMLFFGCVSFLQMACDTVIPIAMVAPGRLGGLGLDKEQLGVVSGIASPFQLAVVLITPQASKLLHHRTAAAVYTLLLALGYMLFPLLLAARSAAEEEMFAFVVIYHGILAVCRSLVFNVFIILFANISYKEVRATVMGIGQVVGGVCRVLGPLLVPALYSWSCKQHSWLFNSNFTFYLLGFFGCLSVFLMTGVSDETSSTKGSLSDIQWIVYCKHAILTGGYGRDGSTAFL